VEDAGFVKRTVDFGRHEFICGKRQHAVDVARQPQKQPIAPDATAPDLDSDTDPPSIHRRSFLSLVV
jgi:hypothetical protein